MNRDLPDTPTNDIEDTPCFLITIKVPVTGHTSERALAYLEHVLATAKRDDECEIFDWEIEGWEQA
jgi:hypothetical protein